MKQGLVKIKNGNVLLIECQGNNHCHGYIRVPFSPTIGGAPEPEPAQPNGEIWKREAGETIEDITLSPSINAGECGHFHVVKGKIV
jgi:hypothetical protein